MLAWPSRICDLNEAASSLESLSLLLGWSPLARTNLLEGALGALTARPSPRALAWDFPTRRGHESCQDLNLPSLQRAYTGTEATHVLRYMPRPTSSGARLGLTVGVAPAPTAMGLLRALDERVGLEVARCHPRSHLLVLSGLQEREDLLELVWEGGCRGVGC